jgi:hypothetical protein
VATSELDPKVPHGNLVDLGDGWLGRGTAETRVAFHEDGATIIYQAGTLIAEAKGVTPRVLAFLFRDMVCEAGESGRGATSSN